MYKGEMKLHGLPKEVYDWLRREALTNAAMKGLPDRQQTAPAMAVAVLEMWGKLMSAGPWEIDAGANTAVYEDLLEGLENCLFHAPGREWRIKKV